MERKRLYSEEEEEDLPYKPFNGGNGTGSLERKRLATTAPQESSVVTIDRRTEKKFSPEELSILFVKHKGHLAKVASELRCSRQTLYRSIRDVPDLKDLLVELREEKLDVAEEQLQSLVEKKNLTAIIFTLKCLGAHRGWVDRVAESSPGGSSVVINIAPANGEGKVITTEIRKEYNNKHIDRDTPAMIAAGMEEAIDV
jgi:hypothetical protein